MREDQRPGPANAGDGDEQGKTPRLLAWDYLNGGMAGYRSRDLRQLKRAEVLGCVEQRGLKQWQCQFLLTDSLPKICACGDVNLALDILTRCPWQDVPQEVREGSRRYFQRPVHWGQEWGR